LNKKSPPLKIGKPFFTFESVASTNAIVKKLAELDFPEGTSVSAETQRKGKGRLGRVWISPNGENIFLSFLLKPQFKGKDIGLLSIITALSVAKTICNFYSGKVHIKWPNDVLIESKKVCGILSELKTKGQRLDFAVIGIGINLNSNLENFDSILKKRSTSLQIVIKKKVEKEQFLDNLFYNFNKIYSKLLQGKKANILKEANEILFKKGEIVKFSNDRKAFRAEVIKINDDGTLRLKLDGKFKDYASGEILF